jgi:SAM-dependent methyltransferase
MFAPRPEVVVREMLRVLQPGGRLAFATWPPETFLGRSFLLSAKYIPPPQGGAPPALWGEVPTVRDRLGSAVKDLHFERGIMGVPALSPEHHLTWMAAKLGPFIKTLGALQKEPAKREAFRKDFLELIGSYLVDNVVRYEYLLTRSTKVLIRHPRCRGTARALPRPVANVIQPCRWCVHLGRQIEAVATREA